MPSLSFAFSSLRKIASGQDKSCPYCGSSGTGKVSWKSPFMQLRRCETCTLMFRWPKADPVETLGYYQEAYSDRAITDLPDARMLKRLKLTAFKGTGLDNSERIGIIKTIRQDGRLLDYGASWGYDVYQFSRAGYDTVGFEISKRRADFGRQKLGAIIETDIRKIPDRSIDLIHASHVLEHICDLRMVFMEFRRLLAPNGSLIIFVPNAGGKSARAHGVAWEPMINENHVLALTAEFFERNLAKFDFSVEFASTPYLKPLRTVKQPVGLEGGELLVIAQDNTCARKLHCASG